MLLTAALAYATSWEKSFRYYDTNVTAVSKIVEYLLDKIYLKEFIQVGTSNYTVQLKDHG